MRATRISRLSPRIYPVGFRFSFFRKFDHHSPGRTRFGCCGIHNTTPTANRYIQTAQSVHARNQMPNTGLFVFVPSPIRAQRTMLFRQRIPSGLALLSSRGIRLLLVRLVTCSPSAPHGLLLVRLHAPRRNTIRWGYEPY